MPSDSFEEYERGATYVIGCNGDQLNITCRLCGLTSYAPADVCERYCGRCKAFHGEMAVLSIYVITDHPRDVPDKYVMRRHMTVINPAFKEARQLVDDTALTADTIEALRVLLGPGAQKVGPVPGDDPVIAEVWMI